MTALRLLSGRDLTTGAETYEEHSRRLGGLPRGGHDLIDALTRTGLTGRGGASIPAGLKWGSAATRSHGAAVVIANGAEGEPQSRKDRLLMTTRPHLVLDGAFLAARCVRANQVVILVGEAHEAAATTMARALTERPDAERRFTRIVHAPHRYVAGESSAVVHLIDGGVATPTTTPPQPHERGVGGAPTLVQNVETLAHAALVARGGDAGSVLVTIAGAVQAPRVLEVERGATIAQAVEMAGGLREPADAVLLGGYFGAWVPAASAWSLPIDPVPLRERGLSLGCGVIGVLPQSRCGVCDTARIMRYLASESSAQCGPCFFGLRALSDACSRIAERGTNPDDLARLKRWAIEVYGRGACRHPDGAVVFLRSALTTFAQAFAAHPAHWRTQPA